MKKQLIPAALICAALTSGTVYAEFSPELPDIGDIVSNTVILTLKAGEPTMTINGDECEIPAPYVTDEDITLVPLRVITETFGAEVDWNGDKQEITLAYDDVRLTLHIGSKAADFGSHTETLDSPPVIVDDVTMVPLRFVAETFGANVSYDEDTQQITVMLSEMEESDMIHAMHEKPYIGNSYYGWSMQTPQNMQLEDSSTDGKSLTFIDENYNLLMISISEEDEDIDPDVLFTETIAEALDSIVSAAEKTALPDGSTAIHLRINDYGVTDARAIVKGKRVYGIIITSLSGIFFEDSDISDNNLEDLYALADTFSLTARDDMYDFSNRVEDGGYAYKNDDYKLSMNLPDSLSEYEYAYYLADNNIVFKPEDIEDQDSYMQITIYSKTDEFNMDSYAQLYHSRDTEIYNPQIITIGNIEKLDINGSVGLSYKLENSKNSFITNNLFFENGDYVYIVRITLDKQESIDSIISSMAAEELDADETGTILDLSSMLNGYTTELDEISVELPKYWYSRYWDSIYDVRTDLSIAYDSVQSDEINEYISRIQRNNNNKIIKKLTWNGDNCSMELMNDSADTKYYISIRGKKIGNTVYFFKFKRNEKYYGGILDTEFEEIVKSIHKNKK